MAKSRFVICLAAVLLVGGIAFAGPNVPGDFEAPAGVDATGSIVSLSGVTDCFENNSVTYTISVTGTTDDGGGMDQVQVQIWDDGVMKTTANHSLAVGATTQFTNTVNWSGPIGSFALGVGVILADLPGGTYLDVEDPFVLEGEEDCEDATPIPPREPIPMTGTSGLLVMIGLLAAVGVFVLLRQRG